MRRIRKGAWAFDSDSVNQRKSRAAASLCSRGREPTDGQAKEGLKPRRRGIGSAALVQFRPFGAPESRTAVYRGLTPTANQFRHFVAVEIGRPICHCEPFCQSVTRSGCRYASLRSVLAANRRERLHRRHRRRPSPRLNMPPGRANIPIGSVNEPRRRRLTPEKRTPASKGQP